MRSDWPGHTQSQRQSGHRHTQCALVTHPETKVHETHSLGHNLYLFCLSCTPSTKNRAWPRGLSHHLLHELITSETASSPIRGPHRHRAWSHERSQCTRACKHQTLHSGCLAPAGALLTVHQAAAATLLQVLRLQTGPGPGRGGRQDCALRGLPGGGGGAASRGAGQLLRFARNPGLGGNLGPGLWAGLGRICLSHCSRARAGATSLLILGFSCCFFCFFLLLLWLWGEPGLGPRPPTWAQPGTVLCTHEGALFRPTPVSPGDQGAGALPTPARENRGWMFTLARQPGPGRWLLSLQQPKLCPPSSPPTCQPGSCLNTLDFPEEKGK